MPFLGILALLCGLGSFVCWILVLIKIFQTEGIGLGILAIICPLFAFIFGWVKVNQYGIKNIMLAWSALIGAGIVLNIVAGVSMAGQQHQPLMRP